MSLDLIRRHIQVRVAIFYLLDFGLFVQVLVILKISVRLHVGLSVELDWFDKETEYGVGEECSIDFGEDGTVMDKLGITAAHNVNNGGFDVKREWLVDLQLLFQYIE